MSTKRVMVTGGAGFIGSNLVRWLLAERPEWEVVNFDALTYAGNLASLTDVESNPHYRFVKGDCTDAEAVRSAMAGCSMVMHLAAESHVDRSILDPGPFLRTNVIGTQVMLDSARFHKVERFLLVSTDEVYGALKMDDPPFTESLPLKPNSPYSASKAAGDLLARAYFKTFDMPVVVSRCSNNYGPFQFPEKVIPLFIHNALNDRNVPVYGDGMQVRDWIFVEDHCRGLVDILEHGRVGEAYNLGGECELPNIEMIKTLLKIVGKPESLISYVTDRPGHDRRYAMDITKAKNELGWEPKYRFEEALPLTVKWYLDNPEWVHNIVTGDYREYYQRQYGER